MRRWLATVANELSGKDRRQKDEEREKEERKNKTNTRRTRKDPKPFFKKKKNRKKKVGYFRWPARRPVRAWRAALGGGRAITPPPSHPWRYPPCAAARCSWSRLVFQPSGHECTAGDALLWTLFRWRRRSGGGGPARHGGRGRAGASWEGWFLAARARGAGAHGCLLSSAAWPLFPSFSFFLFLLFFFLSSSSSF